MDALILEQAEELAKSIAGEAKSIEDLNGVLKSLMKSAILRPYLVEKAPISDLCDRHGIQPSKVQQSQALLFEHGTAAFERKARRQAGADAAKDRQLASRPNDRAGDGFNWLCLAEVVTFGTPYADVF